MAEARVTQTTAQVVASTTPSVVESQYARLFKMLLPRGAAWWAVTRPVLTSNFDKLVDGLTAEADRIGQRGIDLLRNMDPRSADELLPDLERNFGLPDPCASPAVTLAERQAALTARVISRGEGTGPAFILQIAQQFYPNVFIRRFQWPQFTCESECDDLLNSDASWLYYYEIVAPGPAPVDPNFECQIERSAHAHLILDFAYPLFTWADVTHTRTSTAVLRNPQTDEETSLATGVLGTLYLTPGA